MPTDAKSGAPPSFYSNLASMGGGAGAGAGTGANGAGKKPATKPAGEEEIQIVKTLFSVLEKWRKAVGADEDKTNVINEMADVLKKYNDKFVKADMAGGGEPKDSGTDTTSTPSGQSPAVPAAGAGGPEAMPVPA